MSTELHAFLPGQSLPTRTAWQEALNRLEVPLELGLGPETMVLKGFCPMILKGRHTGVEIYVDDPDELVSTFPVITHGISTVGKVINFRWGASPKEAACAFGASSALISSFSAVLIFDDYGTVYKDAKDSLIMMNHYCEMDV